MRILLTILTLLCLTAVAFGGIAATGTASSGGTGQQTIDFSGMSLTAYCVVVVTGGHSERTDSIVGPLASEGYTAIVVDSSSGLPRSGAWYKRMGTVPDADVTCYSGAASDGCAYCAIGLTGVDSTVIDAAGTKTTGYGAPNPPSITTVTDSAWVIAVGASTNYDATPGNISGYTNDVTNKGSEFGNTFTVAMATKEVASAGAENPGAWDAWADGTFGALSVAIRPGVYAGASPGAIDITTTPVGAAVWFDGVDTDSVAPTVIGGLAAGDVVVKLTLTGYRTFTDTVTVIAGDTIVVNETLPKNTYTTSSGPGVW